MQDRRSIRNSNVCGARADCRLDAIRRHDSAVVLDRSGGVSAGTRRIPSGNALDALASRPASTALERLLPDGRNQGTGWINRITGGALFISPSRRSQLLLSVFADAPKVDVVRERV